MNTDVNELAVELEQLFDRHSVRYVLEIMAEIAREKGDYVAEGDSHGGPSVAMAMQWRSVAASLTAAARKAAGL